MGIQVVCLGQKVSADDGVGLAVFEALERAVLPPGTQLIELSDPMALVSILEGEQRVLIVDAVLASPPGRVLALTQEELSTQFPQPTSSHGFGVKQALELAASLGLSCDSPRVRIIAVTIERPRSYRAGLSPSVAAAAEQAAQHVCSLLEADHA